MDYEELVEEYERRVRDEPGIAHCDMFVLHSPGTCEYCDGHPKLQEFRKQQLIQFTNEVFDGTRHKYACPALTKRDYDTIERWNGNVAHVKL